MKSNLIISFLIVLTIALSVTSANASEPFKKFSVDFSGWTSSRTLTDWQALNSLLHSSPGDYSHLRGGEIDQENIGPDLAVSAGYYFHKNLGINLGMGYVPGKTTANFVENSIPHSMYWKSRYLYFPLNLEYKIPFISAERLLVKVFAGGSLHLLNTEIKSDTYEEAILETKATGSTFGFQYGILFEYSVTSNLSIFFQSTEWSAEFDSIEKDGQAIKLSDFRLESENNLEIDLEGRTQLLGLRIYI